MKLTMQDKSELRKEVIKKLSSVPDGKKVHLDKDILEELLFDTYYEQLSFLFGKMEGQKVKVKYPVWTGDFLQKIDLSEVSFDDVLWDNSEDRYFKNKEGVDSREKKVKEINLSNTNAKIDFSKSVIAKYIKYFQVKDDDWDDLYAVYISDCDFSNVDLSNNVLNFNCGFYNSDLSNTGIDLNLNSGHRIILCESNFTGLDLSKYTVDESIFDEAKRDVDGNLLSYIYYSNLSGTGLNIEFHNNFKNESDRDDFSEYLKEGYLSGCYINDKKINSADERQVIKQGKKEEYKKMKDDLISSITNSFEQQINESHKKI